MDGRGRQHSVSVEPAINYHVLAPLRCLSTQAQHGVCTGVSTGPAQGQHGVSTGSACGQHAASIRSACGQRRVSSQLPCPCTASMLVNAGSARGQHRGQHKIAQTPHVITTATPCNPTQQSPPATDDDDGSSPCQTPDRGFASWVSMV